MAISSTEFTYNLSKVQKGKKTGEDNPAKRIKIKDKISNSVKKQWDEGHYENRVNGMTDMWRTLHPNYDESKHTPLYLAEKKYVEYLSQFEDVTTCKRCGKTGIVINVHHVDEDRTNFLPSNLEPLCVPCHACFHYKLQKRPFITIGKMFTFAACHRLPDYEGLCSRWHGHEWSLLVEIKKRVDKKTGMVLDFSELKKIVTENVIDVFDHNVINDVIKNPTAENILIWIWERLMFDAHLKGIHTITLWETPTSKATMDKKGMLSVVSTELEKGGNYESHSQ